MTIANSSPVSPTVKRITSGQRGVEAMAEVLERLWSDPVGTDRDRPELRAFSR